MFILRLSGLSDLLSFWFAGFCSFLVINCFLGSTRIHEDTRSASCLYIGLSSARRCKLDEQKDGKLLKRIGSFESTRVFEVASAPWFLANYSCSLLGACGAEKGPAGNLKW